jgi:hypothetical protein
MKTKPHLYLFELMQEVFGDKKVTQSEIPPTGVGGFYGYMMTNIAHHHAPSAAYPSPDRSLVVYRQTNKSASPDIKRAD